MTPVEAMNDLLRTVERETGRPVVVQADPVIPLAATLTPARGNSPLHVIRYRSSFEPERAYLVGYQCGFLLRAARTPPDARFDLTGTQSGGAEAGRLLDDHFRGTGRSLPPAMLRGLGEQIYGGLLQQLRSIPVGLRVDAWLSNSYPVLAEQQRVAVVRQLNENAQALGPEVRAFAPEKVLAANLGMNAAFAGYFARHWGDALLVEPYRTSGYIAAGDALLRLFDETPDDPAKDRDLIDAWGRSLKLTGWYTLLAPTP